MASKINQNSAIKGVGNLEILIIVSAYSFAVFQFSFYCCIQFARKLLYDINWSLSGYGNNVSINCIPNAGYMYIIAWKSIYTNMDPQMKISNIVVFNKYTRATNVKQTRKNTRLIKQQFIRYLAIFVYDRVTLYAESD